MDGERILFPPLWAAVLAALLEAVVLLLVVQTPSVAVGVFSVTIGGLVFAEAAALVRIYEGPGAALAYRISICAFVVALLMFMGTVAAVGEQTLPDPSIPSFLQWLLPGFAAAAVVVTKWALREFSIEGAMQ